MAKYQKIGSMRALKRFPKEQLLPEHEAQFIEDFVHLLYKCSPYYRTGVDPPLWLLGFLHLCAHRGAKKFTDAVLWVQKSLQFLHTSDGFADVTPWKQAAVLFQSYMKPIGRLVDDFQRGTHRLFNFADYKFRPTASFSPNLMFKLIYYANLRLNEKAEAFTDASQNLFFPLPLVDSSSCIRNGVAHPSPNAVIPCDPGALLFSVFSHAMLSHAMTLPSVGPETRSKRRAFDDLYEEIQLQEEMRREGTAWMRPTTLFEWRSIPIEAEHRDGRHELANCILVSDSGVYCLAAKTFHRNAKTTWVRRYNQQKRIRFSTRTAVYVVRLA